MEALEETKRKAHRLQVKKIEFRIRSGNDAKQLKLNEIGELLDNKIYDLYNFKEVYKRFKEEFTENAALLIKTIEHE